VADWFVVGGVLVLLCKRREVEKVADWFVLARAPARRRGVPKADWFVLARAPLLLCDSRRGDGGELMICTG